MSFHWFKAFKLYKKNSDVVLSYSSVTFFIAFKNFVSCFQSLDYYLDYFLFTCNFILSFLNLSPYILMVFEIIINSLDIFLS